MTKKEELISYCGDEFIYWANQFFTEERLNKAIQKLEIFQDFIENVPAQKQMSILLFKHKLSAFCKANDYNFNPEELMNDIRGSRILQFKDNKTVEMFFIQNKKKWKTS